MLVISLVRISYLSHYLSLTINPTKSLSIEKLECVSSAFKLLIKRYVESALQVIRCAWLLPVFGLKNSIQEN